MHRIFVTKTSPAIIPVLKRTGYILALGAKSIGLSFGTAENIAFGRFFRLSAKTYGTRILALGFGTGFWH